MHSPVAVTAAVLKLKERSPHALLTVDYLNAVVHVCINFYYDQGVKPYLKLIEEDADGEKFIWIKNENVAADKEAEIRLSNQMFLHCSGFSYTSKRVNSIYDVGSILLPTKYFRRNKD